MPPWAFHFAPDASLLDLLGDWDRAFDALRQIAADMPPQLATQFRPVSELLANLDGFETWSRICLEALFR